MKKPKTKEQIEMRKLHTHLIMQLLDAMNDRQNAQEKIITEKKL